MISAAQGPIISVDVGAAVVGAAAVVVVVAGADEVELLPPIMPVTAWPTTEPTADPTATPPAVTAI